MDDTHGACSLIDSEEDPIDVRESSVVKDANGTFRVPAFRGDRTSLWLLSEREDGSFKAVEPGGTSVGSVRDDPTIEFLELRLRAGRDVNAVCHACGAAG